MSINGQSGTTAAGAICRPPLINDSLIADDDEGLPLISAVYSLAGNVNQENSGESAIHGIPVTSLKLDSSKLSSPQIITTQKAASPTPSALNANPVSGDATKAKQTTIVRTPSESTRLEGTLASDLHERKTSPHPSDVRLRIREAVANSGSKPLSSGNVMQLVKLVDSVPKHVPQTVPLLASTSVSGQSQSSVPPTSLTTTSQVKPVSHAPRQIAMKQPGATTSIVLNLKPGEPLPKAINVLGPDGKSVVVLSLTGDGGKPLLSPVSQTGGKILIPLPSSLGSKQLSFMNKVVSVSSGQVPIAPYPGRANVLSPTAGITSPVLPSVSYCSSLQKPVMVSTVVGASGMSPSGVVSNVSETRPPVIVGSQNPENATQGNRDGLSTSNAAYPTKTTSQSPEAKPSSSTADKQQGLTPHEARIQRLKELIKSQEAAVNKLREKRRLEIERIRDSSSTSSPDNEDDAFKPERPPLAEQKRSSSPFAVPLPPKRRFKEQDTSFKTKVPKSTDSSVPGEGAFIPKGDDKSFVQLVGLENVVNNIK